MCTVMYLQALKNTVREVAQSAGPDIVGIDAVNGDNTFKIAKLWRLSRYSQR